MAELTPDQKKKRRTIIIVVIILFLLTASVITGYILMNRAKKKELKGDKKTPDKKDPEPEKQLGDAFPLQKGSKGPNVLYLQRALNRMVPVGYNKLVEDSDFGPLTYTAVITWAGTKYYPVTQQNWMQILQMSNKQGAPGPSGPPGKPDTQSAT